MLNRTLALFIQANASFHQYEWSILESLKHYGLSPVARLAMRLVTSIPPREVKKIVAELRGGDLKQKQSEELSDTAKVFSLPTQSSLSQENSICVYLLINYFLECLKAGKYLPNDQHDMTGDLVYLLARAILVRKHRYIDTLVTIRWNNREVARF